MNQIGVGRVEGIVVGEVPGIVQGGFLFLNFFIIFLRNLSIQHRAQTHHPRIMSRTFHQLSQPGAPLSEFLLQYFKLPGLPDEFLIPIAVSS